MICGLVMLNNRVLLLNKNNRVVAHYDDFAYSTR